MDDSERNQIIAGNCLDNGSQLLQTAVSVYKAPASAWEVIDRHL